MSCCPWWAAGSRSRAAHPRGRSGSRRGRRSRRRAAAISLLAVHAGRAALGLLVVGDCLVHRAVELLGVLRLLGGGLVRLGLLLGVALRRRRRQLGVGS